MPTRNDSARTGEAGSGRRRRLRGVVSGKAGKAIGFTSIAAPILGYVVNDLRKPDSVVRAIVGGVVRRFLPLKSNKVEAIDITDKVEITNKNNDEKS